MKKMILLGIGCLIIAGSCGIFTPREISTLPAVNETNDPFLFAQLLQGTGETFSRYTWQEYFHAECRYSNVTLTGATYSRDMLINYLLQQRELFPKAVVTWQRTEEVLRDVNKLVLVNVAYTITSSDNDGSLNFTGSSDFELVRDASSAWKIVLWRDYADTSFFSPAK